MSFIYIFRNFPLPWVYLYQFKIKLRLLTAPSTYSRRSEMISDRWDCFDVWWWMDRSYRKNHCILSRFINLILLIKHLKVLKSMHIQPFQTNTGKFLDIWITFIKIPKITKCLTFMGINYGDKRLSLLVSIFILNKVNWFDLSFKYLWKIPLLVLRDQVHPFCVKFLNWAYKKIDFILSFRQVRD